MNARFLHFNLMATTLTKRNRSTAHRYYYGYYDMHAVQCQLTPATQHGHSLMCSTARLEANIGLHMYSGKVVSEVVRNRLITGGFLKAGELISWMSERIGVQQSLD